jgi:hypothetical protein
MVMKLRDLHEKRLGYPPEFLAAVDEAVAIIRKHWDKIGKDYQRGLGEVRVPGLFDKHTRVCGIYMVNRDFMEDNDIPSQVPCTASTEGAFQVCPAIVAFEDRLSELVRHELAHISDPKSKLPQYQYEGSVDARSYQTNPGEFDVAMLELLNELKRKFNDMDAAMRELTAKRILNWLHKGMKSRGLPGIFEHPGMCYWLKDPILKKKLAKSLYWTVTQLQPPPA